MKPEQPVVEIPYNFKPRPYQIDALKALENGCKRILCRWARRHGKDKMAFCHIVKAAYSEPGNYYYVFPYYSEARRAIWENLDRSGFRTINHCPKEAIAKIHNQEMKIELINGSIIRFIGLDDENAVRGSSAKGVVFSEFAFQSLQGYKVFMPMIRETNGWMIFISTPNGPNHMYDLESRNSKNDKWYISHIQCTKPDKPNFEWRYICDMPDRQYEDFFTAPSIREHWESIMREIKDEEGFSEDEMEQEYGASYTVSARGSYYSDCVMEARDQGRAGNFVHNDSLFVDTYWDLGKSDDIVCWFVQRDGNKYVFIDYYEDRQKKLSEVVEELAARKYKYRTHYLPHDANQEHLAADSKLWVKFRDLCAEANISDDVVVCPKTNVQPGIYGIRSKFSLFYFNKDLTKEGVKKLELYKRKFDSSKQVYMQTPQHDANSHAADAIRTLYSAEYMEPTLQISERVWKSKGVAGFYDPADDDSIKVIEDIF